MQREVVLESNLHGSFIHNLASISLHYHIVQRLCVCFHLVNKLHEWVQQATMDIVAAPPLPTKQTRVARGYCALYIGQRHDPFPYQDGDSHL